MECFLGIDVGTSATKTLLCNREGTILAGSTRDYPLHQPHPGWSEQDPSDWWTAVKTTIRTVIEDANVPPVDIKAVGLSGQMHGSVFLNRQDEILRPAILWNDQRTAEECEEITDTLGRDRLLATVANPALTGFTAPKILWFRRHEPESYKQTKKILLPKDYIRYLLTGEFATDVSDASGTLLLDIGKRAWSDEILSALDIRRDVLPGVHESLEITGKISHRAARETGLPEGTPVIAGAGDCAAAAVGNGVVQTGLITVSTGTSGIVFAHCDTMQCDPEGRAHTFCHAVPGKWHMMGVVLSAGGAFQWFRNVFAEKEMEDARIRNMDPYDILCRKAEQAIPGCEGLIFLPYLTGERTPHADPFARGAYIGLTPRHDKPSIIRATLEGITYALRDSLEIMRSLRIPIAQIRVTGGGAQSPFWRQLQADVFHAPVHTIHAEQGPAFGVILLAAVATGCYRSIEEACETVIAVTSKTDQQPHLAEVYNARFAVFQNLYGKLKDDFRTMARLAATHA